ncbi:MAG: CBS domain-containing protein [bacterium]|nr:CBS domain-containing protein [bacterium]
MEVITTHTTADFDTLASMIAAKRLYPDAIAVFPGGVEKSVREFLDRFPITGFEQVKPGSVDLDEVERLIIVDTRQRGRIGRFADIIDRQGLDIHIYDHHPFSHEDIRGSVEVSQPYGSTATIMVKILKDRNEAITAEEATVLMLGIYEDTGFLSFVSTTVEDYQAAAWLLSKGADLKLVSGIINREMTAHELALLNEMNYGASAHIINGQEVVVTQVSSDSFLEDAAMLVQKMMDMNDIDVLFALMRMEHKIYLIARSRVKEVDAGELAELFGGGGHPDAASAVIKDITLIELEERLLAALKEKVIRGKRAGDIMSSPVKTITPDELLKEAKEIMSKFQINLLPVVTDDKLIGLISRQDVGKAIYHGLEEHAVREFMTSDYSKADRETPLSTIQDMIIEGNQKFLPIMEKDRLAGCITRTDILRILHFDTKKPVRLINRSGHSKSMKGAIESKLQKWIKELLKKAGAKADEMGLKAYLVGGFVRDLIIGRRNLDIDIVVEGDGIAYAEGLAEIFGGRVRSHRDFGTAVLIMPDGFKIDIASARMEFYESASSALPTVEAGPIKMDLGRRDFTINSMALRLNSCGFAELIDYYGGYRDIKEKTIRVLHASSFIEDPTRAFRAVRIEQRLDFHIGKQTLAFMKNAVSLDFFAKVPVSRIFNELKIILEEKAPISALIRMDELDIMRFIHPDICIDEPVKRQLHELLKVMNWFELLFKQDVYERWLLLFAALLEKLGLAEVSKLLKGIGLAARYRDKLLEIKKEENRKITALRDKKLDDCSLYHILSPLKIETLLFMMAKTDLRGKERISHFITELRNISISTTGKDFKELGLTEGPLYSEIKGRLLDERLKGNIKNRKDELNHIKKTWMKGAVLK